MNVIVMQIDKVQTSNNKLLAHYRHSNIFQHLNRAKFDSLRLLVRLEHVQIVSDTFYRKLGYFDVETGKVVQKFDQATGQFIDDTHIHTTKINTHNGIAVSYAIVHRMNGKLRVPRKYVAIGVSAKLLKERYWEGINTSNIRVVWQAINDDNVIKVPFETFIAAKVVDVDVCIDKYTLSILGDTEMSRQLTCKEIVRLLHKATRVTERGGPALPPPKLEETNVGIQFGKRELVGKAYRTKQFLKFYAKLIELQHHAKAFTDVYIKHNDVKLYEPSYFLRLETTIKNAAHFKTYYLNVKTLEDLLSVNLSKAGPLFFQRPINAYMDSLVHQKLSTANLTAKECIIRRLLHDHINSYWSELKIPPLDKKCVTIGSIHDIIYKLVEEVIGERYDKSVKSKQRRELKKLALDMTKLKIVELENTKIDMLKKLEVNF